MSHSGNKSRRKPWRKVLYEDQGYADNYTAPSFLAQLQRNKFVRIVSYSEAIYGASRVQQQVSLVIIFLMIFYLLHEDQLQPENVLGPTTTLTVLGYLYSIAKSGTHVRKILENGKMVLGVFFFGFIFSPLLHTLTFSISTDTIYSTTFVVMLVHLIFFDYGLDAYMVSNAISLNAAIFATICLSSRLATTFHSFVLLTVAVKCFVLLPVFLRHFVQRYCTLSVIYSLVTGIFSVYLLYRYTTVPLLCTYLAIMGFVTVVCPIKFVRLQKLKDNIHGPWEEAVVKQTDLCQL